MVPLAGFAPARSKAVVLKTTVSAIPPERVSTRDWIRTSKQLVLSKPGMPIPVTRA